MPEFIGTYAFEELYREWVLRQGDAGMLPFVSRRVGALWSGKGPQVDVAAINEDAHAILPGECKWQSEAIGRGVVKDVRRNPGFYCA